MTQEMLQGRSSVGMKISRYHWEGKKTESTAWNGAVVDMFIGISVDEGHDTLPWSSDDMHLLHKSSKVCHLNFLFARSAGRN